MNTLLRYLHIIAYVTFALNLECLMLQEKDGKCMCIYFPLDKGCLFADIMSAQFKVFIMMRSARRRLTARDIVEAYYSFCQYINCANVIAISNIIFYYYYYRFTKNGKNNHSTLNSYYFYPIQNFPVLYFSTLMDFIPNFLVH
jgi:hypothetical protein